MGDTTATGTIAAHTDTYRRHYDHNLKVKTNIFVM